jgi:hypothetical protein
MNEIIEGRDFKHFNEKNQSKKTVNKFLEKRKSKKFISSQKNEFTGSMGSR